MATREFDALAAHLEAEEAKADREAIANAADAKHKHEFALAKLKYATQPRHKAVLRIVLAIIKLPALIVLALLLPFVVMAGRSIPQPLSTFLDV